MTTTGTGAFDVATIPACELSDKLARLVSKLSPIGHMDCATLLVATCDLRTREALALSWRDADLGNGTLSVARSCDDLGRPVPAKSARTVEIPAVAADFLRSRMAVQGRHFRRYAPALLSPGDGAPLPAPDSPIICTPEGNRVQPRAFARWWRSRRCGFGMDGWTVSDLRKARAIAAADAEAGR